MSFNKKDWKDENVATPNKYLKSGETSAEVTLTRDVGAVVHQDPLSANELNRIENAIKGNAETVKPTSGSSNNIVLVTGDTNSRISLEVEVLISGNVTIARNGGSAYQLYSDYALTEQVTELEPGVYTIWEKASAFYLAPSGGSDEWGGLEFIINETSATEFEITHVEFEGIQYELTDDSPFRVSGVKI